jgi:hypothetical protein
MDELQALSTQLKIVLALASNAAFWGTAFALLYLIRSKWWVSPFGRVWAVLATSVAAALDLTIYSAYTQIYNHPLGADTWFYIQSVIFFLLGSGLFAITVVLLRMQKTGRFNRLQKKQPKHVGEREQGA